MRRTLLAACALLGLVAAGLVATALMHKKKLQPIALKKLLLSKWPANVDINSKLDVPIVYINMDRSTCRRKYMETFFDERSIRPTPFRIRGVSGMEYIHDPSTEPWVSPQLHPLLSQIAGRGGDSPSEIGCLLSHMKAILYGYTARKSALLVLEDDVDFTCVGLWETSLSSLIRRLPSDWNFVQLYYRCGSSPARELQSTDTISCSGAVAYLVSERAMAALYHACFHNSVLTERLHDLIRARGLPFTSDGAIFHILDPPNKFVERKPRFAPNNFDPEMESTIHPDHTSSHKSDAVDIWKMYIA